MTRFVETDVFIENGVSTDGASGVSLYRGSEYVTRVYLISAFLVLLWDDILTEWLIIRFVAPS